MQQQAKKSVENDQLVALLITSAMNSTIGMTGTLMPFNASGRTVNVDVVKYQREFESTVAFYQAS